MTAFDSSWLKFWEFVSEFGFIMVIVGVVGEGIELVVEWGERRKGKAIAPKKPRWLLPVETFSFAILVIGLAMEFLGSHNAMRIADAENVRLNGLASAANERAANTESNNLVLQAKVLQLENKLRTQVRQITPTDNDEFIAFLRNCQHKKPVKVFVEKTIFESDFETRNYTHQIRGMLDAAGYGGKDNDIIKLENFSLIFQVGYTNRENPFFIVVYGKQGNVEWRGLKITVDENQMRTVLQPTSEDESCLGDINAAFSKIGLVPDITIRTDWNFVKTNGDWAIFIPAKF
jgi:hypothetical protein